MSSLPGSDGLVDAGSLKRCVPSVFRGYRIRSNRFPSRPHQRLTPRNLSGVPYASCRARKHKKEKDGFGLRLEFCSCLFRIQFMIFVDVHPLVWQALFLSNIWSISIVYNPRSVEWRWLPKFRAVHGTFRLNKQDCL